MGQGTWKPRPAAPAASSPQEPVVQGAVVAPWPPGWPHTSFHPAGMRSPALPSPSTQGCTAWADISVKHCCFFFVIQ